MVTSRILEGRGVGKERRIVRKWLEARVGVVCKIGVLGLKVFPAEVAGKGGNISNQAEFQEEGETFREDRGFGSSERLGGEVND